MGCNVKMSRRKQLFIIGAVAVILLHVVIFLAVVKKPYELSDEAYARAAPDIDARIKADIAILASESLDESLAKLSEIAMYRWPGSPAGSYQVVELPLEESIGREYLRRIWSNRRVLKVLDELSTLPKARRSEVLATSLRRAFLQYMEQYDESLRMLAPMLKEGDDSVGLPLLAGPRLGVLSLLLVAGNLDSADNKDLVREIVEAAVKQYKHLRGNDIANTGLAYGLVVDSSLYNRQILATALAGANPEKAAKLARWTSWEKLELTKYNARSTPFDLNAVVVPVDFSKGKLSVRYLRPMDDATFDAVLRAMARTE